MTESSCCSFDAVSHTETKLYRGKLCPFCCLPRLIPELQAKHQKLCTILSTETPQRALLFVPNCPQVHCFRIFALFSTICPSFSYFWETEEYFKSRLIQPSKNGIFFPQKQICCYCCFVFPIKTFFPMAPQIEILLVSVSSDIASLSTSSETSYICQHHHLVLEALIKCQPLSHVRLFAALWTVAHQAPLSMEFSRQEYWSGLQFSTPGDLPPGIKPESPVLHTDFFIILNHQGSPLWFYVYQTALLFQV